MPRVENRQKNPFGGAKYGQNIEIIHFLFWHYPCELEKETLSSKENLQ